jgi:hypothetical protein
MSAGNLETRVMKRIVRKRSDVFSPPALKTSVAMPWWAVCCTAWFARDACSRSAMAFTPRRKVAVQ